MIGNLSCPDDITAEEFNEQIQWVTELLPASRYRGEADAPPVDREVLIALIRRLLPDSDARAIYGLVASFRSWNSAYFDLVAAEYVRTEGRLEEGSTNSPSDPG